jgi:hypothetical protein
MVKLSRAITLVMVEDYGPREVLSRLSHPYWFQALGCLLGFDWHSSGLTTTVCGALKQGIRGMEKEIGLFIAGGKGASSRKTPQEILNVGHLLDCDPISLTYASRMSAKVDSAALQDGYQLYHHVLVFTRQGNWTVIQQGMNEVNGYARRYHWLGGKVNDFVCEPHSGIAAQMKETKVLNLVDRDGNDHRGAIALLSREEKPEKLMRDLEKIVTLKLPAQHHIVVSEDMIPRNFEKILHKAYELKAEGFEELLALQGMGAKSLRALSLAAEVIYGIPASLRDPAVYSFAHGGKDGHPYPVDRKNYDQTIEYLESALKRAKMGESDKLRALSRLRQL